MATTKTEEFHFSVDGALLSELGEKLVTSAHVALSELVKNAYDADASHVTVSIETDEHGEGPRIIVTDDGSGMTEAQVADFWMRIGTSNKQEAPVSAVYGRQKTGSKGVGRFACRRLGAHLILTTIARTSAHKYQRCEVTFDWSAFHAGDEVESVPCVGKISTLASGTPGTTLEIWGSKTDEWSTRGYNYLRRQLALLASNRGARREGFESDPGFEIKLEIGDDDSDDVEDIRESVIAGSWGTLEAKVDNNGVAHCTLDAKGVRGTKATKSSAQFKSIAGAHLRIGILPIDKSEARDPKLLAEFVLDTITSEWGGIHVRFNGFRMMPYGEPGDDWLQIDADRGRRLGKPSEEGLFDFAQRLQLADPGRAILNMLGMRNYFGDVEVHSRMKGLIPRLDRQGFLDTDAFQQLRRFVRFAVEWATIHREFYIQNRVREEAQRARDALKPVLNLDVPRAQVVPRAAAFLKAEIKRVAHSLPAREREETRDTLLQAVRVIETSAKEDTRTLEHLRLVASASTLTFLFAHEVRTAIGTLGLTGKRLKQIGSKLPQRVADGLTELAGAIDDSKRRLEALVDMTGIVGIVSQGSELQDINLRKVITTAVGCFELVHRNYDVSVDCSEVPNRLMVGPMLEGEVYTIFINLISNSTKSVIAAAPTRRKIKVSAREVGSGVAVMVLDNGMGLLARHHEDVFTPFVSDPDNVLYRKLKQHANPEDAHVFGAGSGLGLSIVRDIVTSRRGTVRFTEPPAGWTSCVEVNLP